MAVQDGHFHVDIIPERRLILTIVLYIDSHRATHQEQRD